jgi:hypothetical protein
VRVPFLAAHSDEHELSGGFRRIADFAPKKTSAAGAFDVPIAQLADARRNRENAAVSRRPPLHGFYLVNPGPRPSYVEVADHLWGEGCNIDSDGDSDPRDATDWTELTLILRPDLEERVDVDPIEGAVPLTLWIRSDDEALAARTATFLAARTGGELRRQKPEG